MAPIKFEENLKDKLEQRTINPSAKGWDTLATRLEAKEEKKSNKKFLWLGVAASFIGVLFMYNMVFINNDAKTTINVVEVENKTEVIKIDNVTKNIEISTEDINTEIALGTEEEIKIETKRTEIKQPKKLNNYIASSKASENRIKEDKIKDSEAIQNTPNESNNTFYALNEIKNNIKNEVVKVPTENIVVTSTTGVIEITDSELDTLLKNAESKIVNTKQNNTVPLDYNELLQDVEDDLEETFRDKLLKTVKGGYRSVKTYVAERND